MKKLQKKKNLVLLPLSLFWAELGNVIFGFADEAAFSRLHPWHSKRVFLKTLFEGFIWVFRFCLVALKFTLLFLLLLRVFWWRWLCFREQFWVCLFVLFPSKFLPLAHHIHRENGTARSEGDGSGDIRRDSEEFSCFYIQGTE